MAKVFYLLFLKVLFFNPVIAEIHYSHVTFV